MRAPCWILCLERLERIRLVLGKLGGAATLRDLRRSWAIHGWEVKEAERLGWVRVFNRKPQGRGRPATLAELRPIENVSFPICRRNIERGMLFRHEAFARMSVLECVSRGCRDLGMPGIVQAYRRIYRCKSLKGASVSTARLLRRPDVQAVRQWYFAKINHRIPVCEVQPRTASGIHARLAGLPLT